MAKAKPPALSVLFILGASVVVLALIAAPFIQQDLEVQQAADSVLNGEPPLVRYDVIRAHESIRWWLAVLTGLGFMICGQLGLIIRELRETRSSLTGPSPRA